MPIWRAELGNKLMFDVSDPRNAVEKHKLALLTYGRKRSTIIRRYS